MLRFLRSTALWILLLPYAITFTGAASNQLVLLVNHDHFPVAMNVAKFNKWVPAEARVVSDDGVIMIDDVHCLMTSKTHLNALADIFDFKETIESVGDLLLEFGSWASVFCPFVWICFVAERLRRP